MADDFWGLLQLIMVRGRRREAARALARWCGAEELMLFVSDPEIDVLIPASGFEKTLPRGRAWPDFIVHCSEETSATDELPSFDGGEPIMARGERARDGTIAVFIGGAPITERIDQFLCALPLVAAGLVLEQAASRADRLAALAHQNAEQSRALAGGLYEMERDLARALADAERTKDRFVLLAELGALLTSSLRQHEMLISLASMLTSKLADVCVIDMVEEPAPIARAHAEASPGTAAVLIGHPHRKALVNEVVVAERALLLRDADEILASLGVTSLMIVPLIAQGRCVGSLSLASFSPGRRYDLDALDLAEDIASRAGLAVSNALLYVASQSAIRAREEFLSIASHEFRTPLTAVKLSLQAIERALDRGVDPTSQMKKIRSALDQAERLERLTTKLLDVTRVSADQLRLDLELVNLYDLTRDAVERLTEHAARAQCELRLSGDPTLAGKWDRIRIDQVLVNLISNALKYGEGKPIEVTVDRAPDSRRGRLVVRDFGEGIPPDAIDRLFRRFERVNGSKNRDGLGLGLYITRRIVESHGGQVAVSLPPGGGACFTVELPLAVVTARDPE